MSSPSIATRERGTLQKTLPRNPIVTLLLYISICTAVATWISHYSIHDASNEEGITMSLILKVLLGTTSSIVGIIYTDLYRFGCIFPICVSLIIKHFCFSFSHSNNLEVYH